MLSSAHVLAMDAKNLLDVVDGIRMKYPNVNSHIIRSGRVTIYHCEIQWPKET